MIEMCVVCEEGKGPIRCEVCEFSDKGVIYREFIDPRDADHWFLTVVVPYREATAKKREAQLLTELDEMKKEAVTAVGLLEESRKKEQEGKARESELSAQVADLEQQGEEQLRSAKKRETELLAQIAELERGQVEAAKKREAELSTRIAALERREREIIAEKDRDVQIGDIIPFGGYDWRVLNVRNGRMLIISDKALEKRAYHNNTYTGITWAGCDLRNYLNGKFYNKFNPQDKKRIAKTTIDSKDTSDKIFLLSVKEAKKYFVDAFSRIAVDKSGAAWWWWLRSPGLSSYLAASVNSDGSVSIGGYTVNNHNGGVRPALWLNL
jgi:hypothetical protein